MLEVDDLRRFAQDGYVVLRDVVPAATLDQLDTEVTAFFESDPASLFPSVEEVPLAAAALRRTGVLDLAEQLTAPLALENQLGHVQVAVNLPGNGHRPGGPHIDGQVLQHPDQTAPDSFTLLAGIFLGDESAPDRGNLWVWPGTHLTHAEVFRDRGPTALLGISHLGALADPPPLPEPVPVLGTHGDVLLAHHLLGHNTGPNLTDDLRLMLYLRLSAEGHRARWAETYLDPFAELAPIARLARPA